MPRRRTDALVAIARLFSSAVVRELARTGRSSVLARVTQQSDLCRSLPEATPLHSVFDSAFALLRKEGFRHEYIYKAALTNRILLGTHSLQTASLLNEFRVGSYKADLAILNGTSTVYEVKSELDSLDRLHRQIDSYMRVFSRVYVIAAEHHVDAVRESAPPEVGILRLNSRYQISTLRESIERPEWLSSAAIFDSIRTAEARMILENLGVEFPVVPNTILNAVLREKFTKLDGRIAHDGMVKVLKKTRNLFRLRDLVAALPASLHAAVLSVPLRRMDHVRLVSAVNATLADALAWA
jgi:hypothetical protein